MDVAKQVDLLNRQVVGVNFTKHFVERFYQRKIPLKLLPRIVNYLDDSICFILYDMALENKQHINVEFERFKIGVVCQDFDSPRLKITTIY